VAEAPKSPTLIAAPAKPGINRELTRYGGEGGWYDGDKVRFRYGQPEKIGGWQNINGVGDSTVVPGVGRNLFTWTTLDGVTYLALGTGYYVRFGILHLIGLSIILAYPFLRFRWLNLALGIVLIALGPMIQGMRLDLPPLEWLAPTPGSGVDYAPLIPWFGRVLIGIFLGNTLYTGSQRRFALPDLGHNALIMPLRLLGENSLLIYLIHQPILLATLALLGVISF